MLLHVVVMSTFAVNMISNHSNDFVRNIIGEVYIQQCLIIVSSYYLYVHVQYIRTAASNGPIFIMSILVCTGQTKNNNDSNNYWNRNFEIQNFFFCVVGRTWGFTFLHQFHTQLIVQSVGPTRLLTTRDRED